MSTGDDVRKSVAAFYTKAVQAGTGCCGPSSQGCCGSPAPGETLPKGFAAQFAGYDGVASGLPVDAIENSFGCGNPLAFSEVLPGQVVLDLGSGAGLDLLIAARKVGPGGRVIGVDMTDEMVVRARANALAAGFANIEVRKGLIEELPVESESVDWVISNCVINLSPEKDRVFHEIARVLRPGGRMSVSDIVVQDVPEWVRSSMALYASCIAGSISEEEYAEGLRRAGLVDVRVTERFPYMPEQVKALVESEIPADAGWGGTGPSARTNCCGEETVDRATLAAAVSGQIWSARFEALKPERR